MAGFRNSQKLIAGVGDTLYTVPAGKSATVSVQALDASGFILAAQQTAISANPLISTYGANSSPLTAIYSYGGNTYYFLGGAQPNAFNTTNGADTANGMRFGTVGANGLAMTNFSSSLRSGVTLDYRLSLPRYVAGADAWYGSGIRGYYFGSINVPDLYSRSNYTYNTSAPAGFTIGQASNTFSYGNIGNCSTDGGYVIALNQNGYYSISNGYDSGGTGGVFNITTSDNSGNNNNLYVRFNNDGYSGGNNTPAVVYTSAGTSGIFVGAYKTGSAPRIMCIYDISRTINNGDRWCSWTLSGPALGTCPLWLSYFGTNWYVGISDGTVWKWAHATRNPFPDTANQTGTITCTQVTLPAGINVNRRPVVASATQMQFGMTTGNFPMVMDTSDNFTAFPNATYPTEISFASSTITDPKIIYKYGATVNDYTIVDATNVYKTVANYSVLDADSYLLNGYTGNFERTGIVLASGDKLIAVQPSNSNCIVQVYGYEED